MLGLSTASLGLFTFGCLFASFVSATTGLAGGVIILSILTVIFDPITALALHAFIQVFSNLSRLFLYREHIQTKVVFQFVIPLIPGCYLGSKALNLMDPSILRILLGCLLIFAAFPTPKFLKQKIEEQNFLFAGLGFFSGLLGMIIGATGPLLAPFFLASNIEKEEFVATKAACQFFTQLIKSFFFFGLVSIPFQELSSQILLGIILVLLGTWLGKRVLGKLSSEHFSLIVRAILVILGARQLFSGLTT